MRRSTVDWVRRSSQTEQTRHSHFKLTERKENKQEEEKKAAWKFTNGVVERLARLFVPNQCRLSLVGHSDGCADTDTSEVETSL